MYHAYISLACFLGSSSLVCAVTSHASFSVSFLFHSMRRTKELWFDRSLFSLGRERDYLIRCSFHLSDSVSECCPRDVRRSSDRSAQALSSHSDSCRQKRGYYFSLFLLLKTFAVSLIDPFRDVDCAKLSRMTTAWTASWGPD